MRVTQTQEWILVAALIAYIAFTPGFQVVRSFLSTAVGKALGLAAIVYVWKCVSPVVALLLVVSFVRCSGGVMREGLGTCPPGTTPKSDMPGKCSKMVGGVEQLVDEVPATTPPQAPMPPMPPSTPTPPATPPMTSSPVPATTQPLTVPAPPTPPPVTESFSPNMKEDKAGGCSFSPF